MNVLVLAQLQSILHSLHGGGSGPGLLLLAGPVCGAALYAAIYRYYRNADKSDAFERETRVELKQQITGQDSKVDVVHGTRHRRVQGDNADEYRARVAELE